MLLEAMPVPELPAVIDGRLYVQYRGRVVAFDTPRPTLEQWKLAKQHVMELNRMGAPLAKDTPTGLDTMAEHSKLQSGGASSSLT